MTPQQQQAINKDLQEALNSQSMPSHLLTRTEELGCWISVALHHCTPDKLQCSYETFKSVWTKPVQDYSLAEMAIALNCVTASSAEQLRSSREAYFDTQEYCRELANKWNAIVKPLREGIERKHKNGLITNEKKLITTH